MAVPTLSEQRQTDIARFYDADIPNVESAVTGAVDGSFLVRMEYPDQDQDGADPKRDVSWCKVLKTVWAEPGYRDLVTIAGSAWKVVVVVESDRHQWKLKLEKYLRPGIEK